MGKLISKRRINFGHKHRRVCHKGTDTFRTTEGDSLVVNTTKEIMMGASDYRDLYLSNFISIRMSSGISTINESLTCRGNHKSAIKFIKNKYSKCKIFSSGEETFMIETDDSIVEIYVRANTIRFNFHGTFERNEEHRKEVKDEFEEISIYINWIYDSHMSTATVPIDSTLVPVDEMYPWLNGESLDSYYQRFMESNASILILIGPPGTGKTSFIRGLLTSTESSAMVTYDEKILSNDGLFSDFIEGSSNVLVIEDADMFLSARKDGNNMMHRFLNVGDGLVTVKGKKMVFSTNLPSIKDIDSALLRPGRCFDILDFSPLSKDQAEKLVERLNIKYTFDNSKTSYTVAEIFSGVRNSDHKSPKQSFGFM